ncbi:MAG: sulfate adenylyltransferase subunit CysN [Beijerinckiaceae bacterium]|nr:sulfate adenylyltransferase subunit CysN [Beijerinckiaceae bacterium]
MNTAVAPLDLARADVVASPDSVNHSLLRFLTCGSVDDGKSTLIGRLLYECGAVFDDQLGALDNDSKKFGTQGAELDFALLVDGLSAEREQGITIDVAYRYFATPRRSFIVADTPGHEQYTRNMATGASTADLAILLVDARKGLLVQTRRHAFIASMLRVRHIVLAVNKMDIVGFDKSVFDRIVRDFENVSRTLGFTSIAAIPVSAKDGDNVARRSSRAPWYRGPALLEHLETIDVDAGQANDAAFAMPVQWVNRPDLDFRGFAGTIASGLIHPGDEVRVLPRGQRSHVARIVTYDGDLAHARAGQAPVLTLADEIDVSRGDLLVGASSRIASGSTITAQVFWTVETPLRAGQRYLFKLATFETQAEIAALHHAIDVNTYKPAAAETLPMNGFGVVTIRLDKPAVFADYADSKELGGFILIDRFNNDTVAIGLIGSNAAPQETAETAAKKVRWPLWLERKIGVAGTEQRAVFMRRASTDAASAIPLTAAVYVASGSIVTGVAVAALDLALRPIIRLYASRAMQRWRKRQDDLNADGGGI